jgi:uncharacterized protein (DUF1330 family)
VSGNKCRAHISLVFCEMWDTTDLDEDELATYSKEVPATLAGHEVKILALYGLHEDLEGPSTEGTVVRQFPSMDAAKAWYNGPSLSQGSGASV